MGPICGCSQEALAVASASQFAPTGEEDVYPAGAHVITHGGMPQTQEGVEGVEGEAAQMGKRTAEWVQEGEEEQDEAKKARLEGDAGTHARVVCRTWWCCTPTAMLCLFMSHT